MRLFLLFTLLIISISAREFGYNKDVRFANLLWSEMKTMKLVGDRSISTSPYRGLPPHGLYVEMIESKLNVGRTNGFVIILKNYISPTLNIMNIIDKPSAYLKSISVMFKRKNGYDSDHKNWFYVQYGANGMIMKSDKGFRLAGKVDKGMMGCISCHSSAPAGDYVFSHDKFASLKESKMYKIRDNKKMKMSVMSKKEDKAKMPESKKSKSSKSKKMEKMEKSTITYEEKNMSKMPFGNKDDITYAKQLWDIMEKSTLNSKPSNLYMGNAPHGEIREVVQGKINGKQVIVKRNYGGKGASIASVSKNRAKYLQSITVMAKRYKGYDIKNADWFWIKYKADGSLHKNEKNIKLAGKIAKGSPNGCIACHLSAPGNSLVFKHNKMINADIVFIKDFVSTK